MILDTDAYYSRVGENAAKRKLQRMLLQRFADQCNIDGPHNVVCMPGASGWDVEYFLGCGLEIGTIHAIECDPKAAQELRDKFC